MRLNSMTPYMTVKKTRNASPNSIMAVPRSPCLGFLDVALGDIRLWLLLDSHLGGSRQCNRFWHARVGEHGIERIVRGNGDVSIGRRYAAARRVFHLGA